MTARVLVVDDVELNVRLLTAKLASEYFEVGSADNGPSALAMVEAELPDIILLDVMMPRMDGFEVCRRLKANPHTADVPVVMVTALSDVADRLRGLEAGADDFLTKPVNDIALFARVRSLVRLKRMMDELRLREDVCRQFGTADATEGSGEDVSASRILLAAEQGVTASRIIDTLRPVAASVVHAASCTEAQSLLDDAVELVIASLSLPDGDPLRLGANDYLIRPVDRNELLARVRTQIRRKRLEERLRENYQRSLSMALTDELTGLYNRRYVFAHLNELLGRMTEAGGDTALMLVDVDHFKRVNDRYGHPAGDAVLRELAERTLRQVRNVDLVGRLGGEEFVVVMPETSLGGAFVVAERLRAAVADEPFLQGTSVRLPLTISIGIAMTGEGSDTMETLLKRADDALYAAKNAGRNRVITLPVQRTPQLQVAAAS